MDRGAWQDTVHGVARVGHNLVTKPKPCVINNRKRVLGVKHEMIRWSGKSSGDGAIERKKDKCLFSVE